MYTLKLLLLAALWAMPLGQAMANEGSKSAVPRAEQDQAPKAAIQTKTDKEKAEECTAEALKIAKKPPAELAANKATADKLPITATFNQKRNDGTVSSPWSLGDTLAIRVGGNHAIKVDAGKALNVWLVLDHVLMKSIGNPVAVMDCVGTDLTLFFHLARDADDTDSRGEWTRLLDKQNRGYTMTLPVDLAIGASTLQATPSEGVVFAITTRCKMVGTLVAGLILFGLVFGYLIASPSALRDSVGGPYSLGKSQMAFWGLLVLLAFAGVWFNVGTAEFIPPKVLVLMGISGATGLGALLIGSGKKATEVTEMGDLEKQLAALTAAGGAPAEIQRIQDRLADLRTPIASSGSFFKDILNDGTGVSFHRMQTMLWTLVLGTIFVSTVAQVIAMPEFSETLLLLLGISNSIYLGFKYPEKAS